MSGPMSCVRVSGTLSAHATSQGSRRGSRDRAPTRCGAHRSEERTQASVGPAGGSGRRQALLALSVVAGSASLTSPSSADVTATLLFRDTPQSAALAPLDGSFGNLVTAAADAEMLASKVMTEAEFQLEFSRLFRQEYPYYQRANKDRLPAIPDLSDLSGGLSNKTYFNFTLYCQWKVLARHLPTVAAREDFVRKTGRRVVEAIAPEALAGAKLAREALQKTGGAGEELPTALLAPLLDALVARGYITGYESRRAGADGQPGGVPSYEAYGSEQLLLGGDGDGDEGATAAAPAGRFTLILRNPADLQGGVALRAEEEGFWQRLAPAAVEAVFEAAGLPVTCDETFFQNEWQSPAGLKQKLLLFIGDPLFQVDVPFTPDTLVMEVVPR